MPPIPLHIEDPIAPSKAQGITPQTEPPQPSTTSMPLQAATTTAATSTQTYPAARPGAAAVPAPTTAIPKAQSRATRTHDPTEQADLPPPPQPGAAPIPNAAAFRANATGIPRPAPTASNSSAYLPPTVTSAPAQAQWSAPQQNYAPTHSTDVSPPPHIARAGPTTVDLGPVSASPAARPPGYRQNEYAQELTSQQRASLDQQEASEKQAQPFSILPVSQTEAGENVWDAVKTWGSKAGEAAAKVHGEAWKWIDSKK